MTPQDDNDRLRAGTLPEDPEADTVPFPVEGSPSVEVGDDEPAAPPPPLYPSLADLNTTSVAEGLGTWMTGPYPTLPVLLEDAKGNPFLPRGVVGCLAAEPGTGKSWGVVQLGLAVAAGRPWFRTYPAVEAGGVAMLMAELDGPLLRFRLHRAGALDGYSADDEATLAPRLFPAGLRGQSVRMSMRRTNPKEGDPNIMPTPYWKELRAWLSACAPPEGWALIVLDPFARFSGADAENSVEASTTMIELAEQLTLLPGQPTVLLVHHTRKPDKGDATGADMNNVRGSSGILGALQWIAMLTIPVVDGKPHRRLVHLSVVKANTVEKPDDPLVLWRDPTFHGALRPATASEAAQTASTPSNVPNGGREPRNPYRRGPNGW